MVSRACPTNGGHLAYPLGLQRTVSPSVLQLVYPQSAKRMVSRTCPTNGGHLAYPLVLRRMVSPSVSQPAKPTKRDDDGEPERVAARKATANTWMSRSLVWTARPAVGDTHTECAVRLGAERLRVRGAGMRPWRVFQRVAAHCAPVRESSDAISGRDQRSEPHGRRRRGLNRLEHVTSEQVFRAVYAERANGVLQA